MTQQADTREQALSYVRHQAGKTMIDLAALLERTAADCERCLEAVSEAQAQFRYGQEWSIKEIMGHLVRSTRLVSEDMSALGEGREPRPAYGEGPPSGGDRPLAELRRELADGWSHAVRLVHSLYEEAAQKPMPEHPMFGPLNGKEWIAFLRLHAMDHVQQMEKVKAHPDYPKG